MRAKVSARAACRFTSASAQGIFGLLALGNVLSGAEQAAQGAGIVLAEIATLTNMLQLAAGRRDAVFHFEGLPAGSKLAVKLCQPLPIVEMNPRQERLI